MSSSANYCRLCLKKFTGTPKLLHKDLKLCDMLKHLIPGMNFNLVDVSTICEKCFQYIQFSYTMRNTVIKNDEKIISYRDSIGIVDKNICRLCLSIELSEATLLYESKYQSMSYMEARSIIEIATVEMRFELFTKPVVCKTCWQIVKTIYLFKKRCFAVEKVLKFYCTQNSLKLLNPKEMKSVSKCYNLHLQNLFEDSNYDLRSSNIPKESIENDRQTILGSINNFIKPIDVYLNNFTTDYGPDDIFEEETDDVFVETPRIVKEEVFEASEPFLESIKEDEEDSKTILKGCINSVINTRENIEQNKSGERLQHVLQMQNLSETNSINLAKKQVKKSCKRKRTHLSISECKPSIEILPIVKETEQHVVSREGKDKRKIVKMNRNKIREQKEERANNDGKKGEEFLQHTEQNKQANDKEQSLEIGHCNEKEKHIFKDLNKAVLENKTLKNKEVDKKARKINETYVCEQCGLKTKYKHHLQRHKLIHNKNGQLLTCSKCIYSTYIERNFKRHALTHTVGNDIQCTQCTYRTVFASHMKAHMFTHETNKDISLKSYCDTQKSVENNRAPICFRCKECPYETSKEIPMKAHLRSHKSAEKALKCPKCHYITTRAHSLKDHMEVHHEKSKPSKKTYKCNECAFVGKRRTHLMSHMLTHKNNLTFSCEECSYKAKRKSHLVTHMLRHKKGNKKIMFKCPYCKYKTIRKDHLKQHHLNQHFDKKPVDQVEVAVVEDDKTGSRPEKKTKQCPYCSYKNKEAHLEKHILTIHFPSASETMHCNYCAYATKERRRLLEHLKVHQTGEEHMMRCNDCDYQTNMRRNLLEHLKLHQNRKKQEKT